MNFWKKDISIRIFQLVYKLFFYLKIKLKSYFEKNSIGYQIGLKNEKRVSD